MKEWGRDRVADVAAIVERAVPGEALSEHDLAICLWEDTDPTIVIGLPGCEGVAAAVVRELGSQRVAAVQLIAVLPGARRLGHGSALLDQLRTWAFEEHGASVLGAGGGAPFYLWLGVDVAATPALCFFERFGFRRVGAELNMEFPATHRAPVPEGLVLRRAERPDDAAAAVAFVARHWPDWVAETRRAIDRRTCLLVVDDEDGAVVGFGCHSVNRKGWLGPMGTDPERRHAGCGNALLGAIANDIQATGAEIVEVSGAGPLGFYANAAGATMSRVFQAMALTPPD